MKTQLIKIKRSQNISLKNLSKQKGVSLIESLVCLTLFCLVFLFSMEVFKTTHFYFKKLKQSEELNLALYSTLDRMKKDILKAGSGLIFPGKEGWISVIEKQNEIFSIRFKERNLISEENLISGQTWIPLPQVNHLKKGQEICLYSFLFGETTNISRVDKNGITIFPPLKHNYSPDKSQILQVKKISFYLDKKRILRRKVNNSPAQPLCEDISQFDIQYDSQNNLVNIKLNQMKNKEYLHAINLFPKNLILLNKPE